MIAQVSGRLISIGANSIVVEAGGIGYRIGMPVSVISNLPEIGEQVRILTYMQVKEDAISLFGFLKEGQRELFEMLITVSGVGPSHALRMLSVFTEEQIAAAIACEDTETLTRIPGIGTKMAQRIVLELKTKMKKLGLGQKEAISAKIANSAFLDDVIEALAGLGYSKQEAKKAAETSIQESGEQANISQVIKIALRLLTAR